MMGWVDLLWIDFAVRKNKGQSRAQLCPIQGICGFKAANLCYPKADIEMR